LNIGARVWRFRARDTSCGPVASEEQEDPMPRLFASLALGLVFFAAPAARAQDPVALYPENYRVLFENERVRVIDFRLAKGATEQAHHHRPHVVYVLQGFRIRFTFPDGTTGLRETKTGDVLWSEAVTHASENIGDTDAHGILVELKEEPRAATAPADGRLTAVTFIRGKEGREAELERELLALTAPTRAEPGALRYDLYQSTTKPNEFMRFEEWRDAAALEAHKATPQLQASFEKRLQQGWSTDITLWKRVPD
jgi:quinol monooxygenase YgiN/quercetin dioxygenase-like cupin family protein